MPDEQTPGRPPYDIDPEIEALLAELDATDLDPVAPPPEIWAGIEHLLADEPADELADAPHARSGAVVDLADRRARRLPGRWLGVAAAAVLVVVGAAVVLNRPDGDAVVATAELAHDAGFDPLGAEATATARLVERDGGYEIVLDDASFPTVTEDADLELWLIEADERGEIVDVAPVALVDGPGTYAVPAELDVATHRIVDISIEPRDDDRTHSGRSILRGALVDA